MTGSVFETGDPSVGPLETSVDVPPVGKGDRHLLSVAELGREGIEELLDLTDTFVEVSARRIPRVPALRGRTVALMFFENSTRTRMSFELAAKRLSADTTTFSASGSSLAKGESLRDTFETVAAMGVDAIVVRHRCAGVPHMAARWVDAAVVNAGDGAHEHPTQALLDCYTIRSHFGRVAGLRVAFVGDIAHSRVARSGITALSMLGAEVVVVAPSTLVPPSLEGWPVSWTSDFDEVVGEVDVVYMLRIQRERQSSGSIPSLREYSARYALDEGRLARMKPDAVVMHPGPVNRGIEMCVDVSATDRALVVDQVRNGVAARMAVLFWLLSPPRTNPTVEGVESASVEPDTGGAGTADDRSVVANRTVTSSGRRGPGGRHG
ncbi:MAG: aspartate carbamoyltransferase [Acidimicrobiales bacterium]|nr:MAG: aspartate carbamoyltransferase [Acidimicrobiales bacterium]